MIIRASGLLGTASLLSSRLREYESTSTPSFDGDSQAWTHRLTWHGLLTSLLAILRVLIVLRAFGLLTALRKIES